MLERWILASLLIVTLVVARVLLRRYVYPRFEDRDGCDSFNSCMTGSCNPSGPSDLSSPPPTREERTFIPCPPHKRKGPSSLGDHDHASG